MKTKGRFVEFFISVVIVVATIIVICFVYFSATKIDYPWYFDALNILENRKYGQGNTVGIAIIDSGFDMECKSYITNDIVQYDATGDNSSGDSTGHGTNMALLIGSNSNSRNSIYGINPNVKLYSIKVSNSLGFTNSNYLHDALEYCKSLDISIVNISLGGTTYDTQIKNDIDELKRNNVFVVCAAGDNEGNFLYPADYESSYCIVAQKQDSTIFAYSNLTSNIDKKPIIAPGTNVDVLAFGQEDEDIYLTERSGSSFATAIFSGYLSLYLAKNSLKIAPSDFDRVLEGNPYSNGFLSIL